ncbi:restriction endonuclease subunit S [Endozoicomonas gorgoniicola]|uniref:Restriction endonuclease subunit S n=1 Tax=Endozoicomonas gorgoniicola TaxID=1234144 RepID=A0ABT3MYN4_9GAMM|nr:restriction endonuclease subunit S [Endozoicomonas gorgoniicola]MCW7554486.1 restriction endonuclease subunit S [Endozoicomonas gorgoniicola]
MQKLFSEGVGSQDANGQWQPHTGFKDSELGRIPAGWEVMQLGDAALLQRGFDLPSQDRIKGEVPIISSSGVAGYHNEYQVKGPGVVTGRYGTIGEVFYVEPNHWPLNTSLWVKDFHGNYELFVYYLLKTIDFKKFSEKTGVPGVNRNDLHKLKIALPPVLEQKEISKILQAVETKLNHLTTQKSQTQQLKKGLMQKLLTGQIRVKPEPQDH